MPPRRSCGPAAKSLVNALLRRYLRDRDAILAAVRADPVARWSYPQWWIDRVLREYPDDWTTILEAGNVRPPLALRVNRRITTRANLIAELAAAGVSASAAGEAGILVDPPRPVTLLPGYGEGAFSVQDLGAQLAAPLLAIEDGMRVLDACAAPGGKTTHIAELADVELRRARHRRFARLRACAKISTVFRPARRVRESSAAMPVRPRRGGMVGPSTAFSPTFPARRRA